MYENVIAMKPPREKSVPAAPPSGTWNILMAGFWNWAPYISLLFLVLCLMLSAVTIGLTVKYLHVSRELDYLSMNHIELNNSLTQRLENKEDLIETMRHSLEQLVHGMKYLNSSLLQCRQTEKKSKDDKEDLNSSLLRCQQDGQKSQDDKEEAEFKLSETRSKLNQWKQDFCPKDWTLFGKKCLWISKDTRSWDYSKRYCEYQKNSNIMVVQSDDSALQDLLSEQQSDYWVTKEYVAYSWNQENKRLNENCWKVSSGRLQQERCYNLKKCICERPLVLASQEAYPNRYKIDLYNSEYSCSKS
ncbi:B-cell differentiation antigen CD72-like isoform X1 [Mixophyes fleayi]